MVSGMTARSDRPLALAFALAFVSACSRGPCSDGATQTGHAPPQGTRQWCQKLRPDQSYANHGPSTEWYANTQVKEQGNYVEGQRDGRWTRWYETGQKAWEGEYQAGQKVGRWLRWDTNGHKTADVVMVAGKAPEGAHGGAESPPDAAETDASPSRGPGIFGTGAPPPKRPDNDEDKDGVPDTDDNCPYDADPLQLDTDGDKQGDVCDDDIDGDKRDNIHDNCPRVVNWEQEDTNHDERGDACDPDIDGDGVPTATDNCPKARNPDQADADRDGTGDACAAPPAVRRDTDGDGFQDPGPDDHPACSRKNLKNCFDNCPGLANPDQDLQACSSAGDFDHDGVLNTADNCYLVPNPDQKVTKGQLITEGGDACYLDEDGDNIEDARDNCPLVKNLDQKSSGKGMPGDACIMHTETTTP